MLKLARTEKQKGLATAQFTADEAKLALGKDDIQIRQHELCLRRG
jgi:hypothetical protein